jgi:hypothetical protein
MSQVRLCRNLLLLAIAFAVLAGALLTAGPLTTSPAQAAPALGWDGEPERTGAEERLSAALADDLLPQWEDDRVGATLTARPHLTSDQEARIRELVESDAGTAGGDCTVVGFVSRAWEDGAYHDALVRPQVVYQDLVAQAAESLACTGEGGRFIAVIASPENSPQIYAVGDMGPSAAHQIQIDQADEPDPIGITAYQSAAFGLEAFRAHLTGAPTQPRLVDRNYPAEAMETTPFGDQLQEPRPFQAGGLNPTVLWWTIGAGAVGCVLVAVVRPLRRPVRLVGVLTFLAVMGG